MSVSGDTVVDEGLNALSWVHDELRRSLEGAHKSLRRYLRAAAESTELDPVDPAILRQARAQLHQAVGAVELVGLGPAGLVLHAGEQALQRLSMRPKLITLAAVEAIERGSFAVLDYIGRRLVNKSVTPLSLFPQYRVLQELAGASRIHPADLWPVSFGWRNLPVDASVSLRQPDAQAIAQVESDLLAQMRGAPPSVSARMSEVFAGLAASGLARLPIEPAGQPPRSHVTERQLATLWQLASAFYEAQADGLLKSDIYSKRIGSRLLAQLRAGTQAEPSMRLAHDLLFFCSQATPRTGVPVLGLGSGARLRAVREAYALADEPVVDFEVPRLGRFDPALVAQARKRVAAAKELWSSVAGGDLSRLPGLAEQMALVSESLQRLYPDGGVLGRALHAAAQHTASAQAEPPAELAMEVATALLYLDASLDDADFDQPELSQRIHRLAQRIDQVRQKRDPGMLELWMEDLYRRVSDRQTMGNVVQELRASLSEVERSIDQYFRSPSQRDLLIPVPAQLQSMRGVLSVLGLDQASQAVARMSEDVDVLADTEADPMRAIQSGSFDRLADNLGALSFLIDMVAVQPQMAKSLFRFDPATGSLSAVMARQERPSGFGELDTGSGTPTVPPSPDTDAVAVSLEFDRIVKQAKTQQRTGAGDIIGGAGLPLLSGADLLRDSLPMPLADASSARAWAPGVVGGPVPAPAAESRPSDWPTVPGKAAPVSGTTVVPLVASSPVAASAPAAEQADADPEMRAVFLEEAHEVLQTAREGLAALATVPDDRERIVTVRRAFHTLKGSSRMVGLKPFGEAAWACEQLYNARLAVEPVRTDAALQSFSQEAVGYFERWVDALADGDDRGFSPEGLIDAARGLTAAPEAAPSTSDKAVPAAPATASGVDADLSGAPVTPVAPADANAELRRRVPELPSAAELELPDLPTMPMDLSAESEPAPSLPPAPAAPLLAGLLFEPEPAAPPRSAAPAVASGALPTPAAVDAQEEADAMPTAWASPEFLAESGLSEPAPLADGVPSDASLADLMLDELAVASPWVSPTLGAPAAVPSAAPQGKALELPALDLAALEDESASPLALEATMPLPTLPDLATAPAAPAPPAVADTGHGAVDLSLDAEAADAPFDDSEVDLPLDMASARADSDAAGAGLREPVDGYKQIGPLRISQALFNIYISEAEDLSRELIESLAAWRERPDRPPGEMALARAHSLAGSSGTVGYSSLANLARTLEHAIERAQMRGRALADEPELFCQAADEARRLLHLFAAGFLNQPDERLLKRLQVLAQAAPDDEASVRAASSPMPLGRPSGFTPLFELSEFEPSGIAPLAPPVPAVSERAGEDDRGAAFDDEVDQVDAIDPELFAVFEEEGLELLPRLHASLRDWSRRPDDLASASACMRSLHTFKGGARLAGAMRLGELAHRLETAIERLIARGAAPSAAEVESVVAHADALDHQFDLLRGAPVTTNLDALVTLPGAALAFTPVPAAPAPAVLEPDFRLDIGPEPLPASPPPAVAEPLLGWMPSAPPAPASPASPQELVPMVAPEALPAVAQAPEARAWVQGPDLDEVPLTRPAPPPEPAAVVGAPWLPEADSEDGLPTVPSAFDDHLAWASPAPVDEREALAAPPPEPAAGLAPEDVADLPLPLEPIVPAAQALAPPEPEPEPADVSAASPAVPIEAGLAAVPAAEPIPEAALPLTPEPLLAAMPMLAAPAALAATTALVAPAALVATEPASAHAPVPTPAPADAAVEAPPPSAPAEPVPPPKVDWRRFLDAETVAVEPPAVARAATGSVRVRAAILDRLVGHAGEVSIARARIEADVQQFKGALGELTDNLERLRSQLRAIELQAETQIASRLEAARAAQQQFDPLEMDRFTRFQELTRMMAESVSDVATVQRSLQRTLQGTEDTLAHQHRMSRDMQDDLMRTRLVEFEGLSERLYRVVRQAAKETGKPVRLDIVGGSIEVDRGVLDRMTPAFEHLLRNSVVHGIEPPPQRSAAGKDATGHITLSVGQIGNEVAVEVRDDGAGLNLERIRERGLAMGLIAPDVAPDAAELANLIFQPGFTTAHEVTEMAGRGVGMDVVRTEVNAIGGRIETASTPGQGASFRLVLPLTTAVTQVVMLRCGDRSVAVPSTLIESVTKVPAEELAAYYERGVAKVAERELPFFWFDALLQGTARGVASGRNAPIVVVRSANRRVVLHVDEVLNNQEVVVKPLGPQLARLPGLVGMTLLPSGRPALIYNPVPLANLYGAQAQARVQALLAGAGTPEPTEQEASATLAPLVMVVDDSLTVRRVTQRLLEREGYRVLLAKDGQEALDRLGGELPVVVLSDIEMPRMDGFDLLRSMRAAPRLAELPVIMITSRLAQKHRDYAAELGANHYLGKPYAEEELLRLVARYALRDTAPAPLAADPAPPLTTA